MALLLRGFKPCTNAGWRRRVFASLQNGAACSKDKKIPHTTTAATSNPSTAASFRSEALGTGGQCATAKVARSKCCCEDLVRVEWMARKSFVLKEMSSVRVQVVARRNRALKFCKQISNAPLVVRRIWRRNKVKRSEHNNVTLT